MSDMKKLGNTRRTSRRLASKAWTGRVRAPSEQSHAISIAREKFRVSHLLSREGLNQ